MAISSEWIVEELLPFFGLKGSSELFEDPESGPTRIIRTNQEWRVECNWKTEGPLNYLMCGKWYLKLCLHKMCNDNPDFTPIDRTVDFVPEPHEYTEKITVSAGQVKPGIYQLVLIVGMKGPKGVPGPISAYWKGPIVNFYDAGPLGK